MLPAVGLYYPWIHFRGDDWVKVAMLYWDRLQRIVPSGYARRDSDTVRAFADHGWIGEHDAVDSRARVARVFARVIREHAPMLRAKYAVDEDLLEYVGLHAHNVAAGMPTALAAKYALIHVDKVAYSLQRAFIDSELAVASRGRNREWLGVHSDLANVYMTALAHDISLHGAFQPVTETTVDHVAVAGWSVRQLTEALLPDTRLSEDPRALDEPVSALAFIAIRSVVPKDVRAITAAQIADVRQRYAPELRNFHDSLTAMAGDASLSAVTDPVAFQLHLTTLYEDRLAPKLAELERDLRLFHLDTVPTWLSVKTTLPPALAWLFGDVGLHDPGASTAGALALAVVGLRTSAASSAQAAVRQNPAAYLLRLKETLGPSDLRTEIRKAVRRVALKV